MKRPDPIVLTRTEHVNFINRHWINQSDRASDDILYEEVQRLVADAMLETPEETDKRVCRMLVLAALNAMASAAVIVVAFTVFRP